VARGGGACESLLLTPPPPTRVAAVLQKAGDVCVIRCSRESRWGGATPRGVCGAPTQGSLCVCVFLEGWWGLFIEVQRCTQGHNTAHTWRRLCQHKVQRDKTGKDVGVCLLCAPHLCGLCGVFSLSALSGSVCCAGRNKGL
jgi:hypothetical protein